MKRRLAAVAAVVSLGLAVVLPGIAGRAGAVEASNKNVSQSYASTTTLKTGMLVSLAKGSSTTVAAANTNNANRLVGVVVGDNSLVAVDPDTGKAQVASSGSALALVSTVNGDIKAGDAVAVSPFNGIGMRATAEGYVVGRAQEGFSSKSSGATAQKVTDKSGKSQTISVGYVRVTVVPGYAGSAAASENMTGLQQWVRSFTGRTVSMVRIVISLIVALLTIITIVVLTYAAIYGSIISIGRNPLARGSILEALRFVLVLAVMAMAVAFVLIYFLLR